LAKVGKRVRYIGLAVLLIAALAVSYFILSDSELPDAAPEPPKPVRMTWADGSDFVVAEATKLIQAQALDELKRLGFADENMRPRGSYTVELTVDPKVQKLADDAVRAVMTGQPANLRQALVAVDPKTGRVLAYHGYNGAKPEFDYATSWQNPGSLFMPFVLVALLKEGKGLGEVYDGHSPRKFGNAQIRNTPGTDCPQCTVAEAMRRSTNTVFADVAFNSLGAREVARAAIAAGIPPNVGSKQIPLEGKPDSAPNINIAIGGGEYQARPLDIAGAYATFAANGTKRKPHLIARVLEQDGGKVVYEGDKSNEGKPAFDATDADRNAQIARNVTESLLAPADGKAACGSGMVCAGKSGLYDCPKVENVRDGDICAAWMAGYTTQISTAVWVGGDKAEGLKTKSGTAVAGNNLPGQIWQQFMNAYAQGKTAEPFPPYVPIGKP
jgi:membrane peptidoglycan carboxypeptidase